MVRHQKCEFERGEEEMGRVKEELGQLRAERDSHRGNLQRELAQAQQQMKGWREKAQEVT